ncbi:MAG: STAS domain-containing protein [Brevinematia bacterium]
MEYKQVDDIIIINAPESVDVEEAKVFSNFFQYFLSNGFRKFVINFSKTKFISSAFLSALVSFHSKLIKMEGNIVLSSISFTVRRVLEITDLSSLFLSFTDDNEAINYFSS